MTTTALPITAVPAMTHREAMRLAEVEASRMVEVVGQLGPDDFTRPTDCEGWDVKALLSHVLGSMVGNVRPDRFLRAFRSASAAAARSGRPMIDELTALHVRAYADMTPAEIQERICDLAHRAARGRRRTPAPFRSVAIKPGAPFTGTWKLGYLIGPIMNRDYWMHRVDLCRSTGRELVLSPDHDGRIVADVVAEWARGHGRPFTLTLAGPAGGSYTQGDIRSQTAEVLDLDAVEFCRILSGRARGTGLLTQEVPF